MALVGIKKHDGSKEIKLYSLDRFHFEFRLTGVRKRYGPENVVFAVLAIFIFIRPLCHGSKNRGYFCFGG